MHLKKRTQAVLFTAVAVLLTCGLAWTGSAADEVPHYYVAVNGNDGNDGTSWDSPWATLAHAIDKVPDRSRITLGDGRFECLNVTKAMVIDRPLTIDSLNGREKTTVYITFNSKERALTVSDADAVIRGITFLSDRTYGNLSSSKGRGCLEMSAGRVEDCVIAGFSCASATTIGVAANLSGGTICNTVISNNYNRMSGNYSVYGVLALTGEGAVADRCTVVDNEVASGGSGSKGEHGAVYVADSSTLRNSLVARNTKSDYTSGVNVRTGGVVDNCTIVGNSCASATTYGGVSAASGAIIRNTIIAGNTNKNGEKNFTLLDAEAEISNSCSPDDISGNGEGNFVGQPEFVDKENGDYHLAAGACVNGGEVLEWMDESSRDLDGNPRKVGAKPDMGCYEKAAGKLTVSVVPSATSGLDSLSVDFTAFVDGAEVSDLTYSWYVSGGDDPDFNDVGLDRVHWDYLKTGTYTVRITVETSSGDTASATYEDLITVAPSVIFVSKTSSPVKPYGNWETAANTIADALEVAIDGVTVLVGDGVYTNETVAVLDKAVVLASANGPANAFIRPLSGSGWPVEVAHAGAVLRGFTFKDLSGQAVGMSGGTVTNCVFANNTTGSDAQSGGVGVCVLNGRNVISHCLFDGNNLAFAGSTIRHGAAAYVASAAECTIDSCSFLRNAVGQNSSKKYGTAVYFAGTGHVRNCLFAQNSAMARGKGIDEVVQGALAVVGTGGVDVENCTFVGNSVGAENCAGLYASGRANIVNCLFADNTNASGVSNVFLSAESTLVTCREADDLNDFKAPEDGDYRLSGRPPCVDGGTELEWMDDAAKDLDGLPRVRLVTVDIGCYELQQHELELSVTADVTTGFEPLTVTFTADAYCPGLDGFVYSWSFVDGGETYDIVDSPSATAVKTYSHGLYRVRVKATARTGESVECDLPEDVLVTIGKVYIDPSDPSSPRLDEVLANEFLGEGAVITIRNGTTNEVVSAIAVDKPVRIVAEPGKGETFIRPQVTGDFRMLTLSDSGALLSGFTICGSSYQAIALVGGGTVSNCVFRGNSSGTKTETGTGGAAAYVEGMDNLITHCVFTNNWISFAGNSVRMGAAVFVSRGGGCDIDNCVFRDNHCGTGTGTANKYGIAVCHEGSGRIRNCLFADNGANPPNKTYDTHTLGTLAVYNGKSDSRVDIENCTIADNRVGGENCAGLYTTGNTTVNVLNCLIAHNADLMSVSNCELSANTTLTSSRITDGLEDFKRPARGNFHLKASSPAKDAGTFAEWMSTATDLDGNPRVRQGEVDIGCYEGLKTGFMILVGGDGASSSGKKTEPVVEEDKALPVLRVGIVSDIHVSDDSDPADSRTWGNFSNHLFENAITKFRDRGVDAIVVPGDLTQTGTLAELENTEAAWRRVFPDGDVDADGNAVAKLFIRGNHDDMGSDSNIDNLVRKDPSKAWKDVFGIDWYGRIMVRDVKGYVFILVDWDVSSAELDAFFVQHGADLPKDRPMFFVQHEAPPGTIGANPGETLGGCSKYLKNYPNCIALSGHSHDSITLGDQTWQGDFLSLGCGCLRYVLNRAGRDNSWNLASDQKGHAARCSSAGHQGMFLTVYADRIVVERLDIEHDEKVGPDHVFPRDGTKPYSVASQRARAVAPQFPAGSVATVSERAYHYRTTGEKWTDEDQVIVTVPRAARCDADEGRVYEYECTVYTDDGGESNPILVRKELAANWFLNDARVEESTIIAFGKDELPADVTLHFAIRPMDDWGNRGNPIHATKNH